MRPPFAILVAAGLFACAPPPQQMAAAPPPPRVVPPTPVPPALQAPICARPAEKQALDVSALISELLVITITCHTEDKYNALIPHLRPALEANERTLNAFFARAYGRDSQRMHDNYITELANSQSQLGLRSGDQFCRLNAGIFDEVMPLQSGADLARYAASKPIQQALAVTECAPARKP